METARLLLRPVEERDAPALAQLYRDPGIARWYGVWSDAQVAEWAHLYRYALDTSVSP